MLPEWRAAFEHAAGAAVTMVVGESDTGKTTLVTALINALVEQNASVAVIDADLGQSELGPPTTVGLGRARQRLTRLREAELVATHFVGCTSPAGNLVGTLAGCGRLLQRARQLECRHIVVDTSGLVAGDIGRTLKQAKIDLLAPDLLICLERGDECEGIVRPYLVAARPRTLRLPVVSGVRRRSAEERQRHRGERLQVHFDGAQTVQLDLHRVVLRQPSVFIGRPLESAELSAAARVLDAELLWGERRSDAVIVVGDRPFGPERARAGARALAARRLVHYAREDFEGSLAGLTDQWGDTLGLGRIRDLDFQRRTLTIDTVVDPAEVVTVMVGREKYPE